MTLPFYQTNKQGYWLSLEENPPMENDRFLDYQDCLIAGRNYLVGKEVSMPQFLKKHTTDIPDWMTEYAKFCFENPDKQVRARSSRYEYVIYARGNYVEIGLPYHSRGGEKHWITKDGKTRVLVNKD